MIFFKFPFKETIFTTDENSDETFVRFFSFAGNDTLNFKGNIIEIEETSFLNQNLSSNNIDFKSHLEEETETEYLEKLEKVIDFIKENHLSKLVISRRKNVDFDEISLSKTFLNLCESYPNAFVYLLITKKECWIGAFSELLGKFNKKTNIFETMSLAGTLPVEEQWTEKEIEEQKPVTNYIKNILENYTEKVEISKTYDHISGNIKHLRNDFKAEIKPEHLEKIIAELHPTPAVCGIPKQFCKESILNFEKYPREFYAGYSKTEMADKIYFFVNLRCAKLFKNHAEIFVGGGITAQSNPENEWRETELKSQAITKNLKN